MLGVVFDGEFVRPSPIKLQEHTKKCAHMGVQAKLFELLRLRIAHETTTILGDVHMLPEGTQRKHSKSPSEGGVHQQLRVVLLRWFLPKKAMRIIGTTRLCLRSGDDDTLDRQREVSMRFLKLLFVLDIKGCLPDLVMHGARLTSLLAS